MCNFLLQSACKFVFIRKTKYLNHNYLNLSFFLYFCNNKKYWAVAGAGAKKRKKYKAGAEIKKIPPHHCTLGLVEYTSGWVEHCIDYVCIVHCKDDG